MVQIEQGLGTVTRQLYFAAHAGFRALTSLGLESNQAGCKELTKLRVRIHTLPHSHAIVLNILLHHDAAAATGGMPGESPNAIFQGRLVGADPFLVAPHVNDVLADGIYKATLRGGTTEVHPNGVGHRSGAHGGNDHGSLDLESPQLTLAAAVDIKGFPSDFGAFGHPLRAQQLGNEATRLRSVL